MGRRIMEKAIVIKRGKAWLGYLNGTSFVTELELGSERDLAKQSNIDWSKDYVELHTFLKLTNPKQTKKQSEEIRKEIGYTKVFIFVEDNDDYWKYTNHKCNICKKTCKQSSKVEVVSCPQFEELG